ncbi:MAG: hypothetical protein ABSD46_01755 [Bacteroidota bacterium]
MIKPALGFVLLFVSIFNTTCTIAQERVWTLAKHLELAGQVKVEKMTKSKGESYRFILRDPGFTSSKIILITKDSSSIALNACYVSLHDYYGGRSGVLNRTDKVLSTDEWRDIEDKLSKLDFWHYSSIPTSSYDSSTQTSSYDSLTQTGVIYGGTVWVTVHLDGSYWMLEGARDGVVRKFEECSPDSGDYRELCLSMWRISGLFMGFYKDIKR